MTVPKRHALKHNKRYAIFNTKALIQVEDIIGVCGGDTTAGSSDGITFEILDNRLYINQFYINSLSREEFNNIVYTKIPDIEVNYRLEGIDNKTGTVTQGKAIYKNEHAYVSIGLIFGCFGKTFPYDYTGDLIVVGGNCKCEGYRIEEYEIIKTLSFKNGQLIKEI